MPDEVSTAPPLGIRGRTVLLTGATGFLGRHLAEELLVSGARLHLLSASPRACEPFRERHPETRVHSLVLGETDLVSLLRGLRPDLVVHLAARGGDPDTGAAVWQSLDVNLRYGAALGLAMAAAECPLMLMAGSHFQHFENQDDAPFDAYAVAKTAQEAMLRGLCDLHGLSVLSLHLGDVLGPGDPRPKVVNALLQALRSGAEIALSGGDQWMSPLHVEDAAGAFRLGGAMGMSASPGTFQRWAVRPPEALRLRDLATRLEGLSGQVLRARWGALAYRHRERMQPWQGLPALPGWWPRRTLDDLLKEMWETARIP